MSNPKVAKFEDGIIVNGTFGSPEVDDIIVEYGKLPLVIADVPYGDVVKDNWDKGITADNYIQWTKDILGHLVQGGSAYIYGGIGKKGNRVFFEYLSRVEKETKATMRNLITWRKRKGYGKKDDYLFIREECAWLINDADKPNIFNIPLTDKERPYAGWDPKYPAKSKYYRVGNVWDHINELFRDKLHVAEKPWQLAAIMVNTNSVENDWILDPFAGSGSTALACRKLNRRFILIEQDLKNFEIIIERLRKA